MPRADVKPLRSGAGWGCSCPSFMYGEPTPEKALAALARSANVTVADNRGCRDGRTYQFIAWTNYESQYVVTFDPLKSGGFCKHCLSCLIHFAPWFRQVALGASETLDKIKQLEKENKKLRRALDKKPRL